MSSEGGIGLAPVAEIGPEQAPEIVELLEELLAKAKAGEIRAIVVIHRGIDGVSAFSWKAHNTADALSLVGGVEWAKANLVAWVQEGDDDG